MWSDFVQFWSALVQTSMWNEAVQVLIAAALTLIVFRYVLRVGVEPYHGGVGARLIRVALIVLAFGVVFVLFKLLMVALFGAWASGTGRGLR